VAGVLARLHRSLAVGIVQQPQGRVCVLLGLPAAKGEDPLVVQRHVLEELRGELPLVLLLGGRGVHVLMLGWERLRLSDLEACDARVGDAP
tara:strand:- start:332 stop:604 length:273 start_codon:yes stop_codon:yes gene_type:complete